MRINPEWTRFALFVFALLALAVLLYFAAPQVGTILQMVVLVVLLSVALNGPIAWLVARGMRRWVAVTMLFVSALLLFIGFAVFVAPVVVREAIDLAQGPPSLFGRFEQIAAGAQVRFPFLAPLLKNGTIGDQLVAASGMLLRLAQNIFVGTIGFAGAVVLVAIATFYALLEPWPLLYGLRGLFPTEWWGTVTRVATAIGRHVQGWVLGTFVLVIIIGVLDLLGLVLVNWLYAGPNLQYIIFFAILGGLMEIIPVVGPTVAAIVPTAVALTIDPVLALLVLIVFVLVQALENQFIVPVVMGKAVDMHPVTLLAALAVMSALFGLFGALIAVPAASMVKVLYDEWYYPLLHNGEAPPRPLTADGEAAMLREALAETRGARAATGKPRRSKRGKQRGD